MALTTTTKLLVLAGGAGIVGSLAPVVPLGPVRSRPAPHLGRGGRLQPTLTSGAPRAPPSHPVECDVARTSVRLGYRRLSSEVPAAGGRVDASASTSTSTSTTPYNATTAALEQLLDAPPSSTSRHLEEIGDRAPIAEFDRPHSTPSAAEASASATVLPSSQTSTSGAKSEVRVMVQEIAAIALPSLGGMLLDPIMSLVDTACVGQVSTTALAAMAPCTSIFQFAFFAFFFLSASTTSLVASNPPEAVYDPNDTSAAAKRVDFNERVVSNAAGLAIAMGSLVALALFRFSDPLLHLAGIPDPALLNAARPYLRIRAIGLPFVFLATVLQGSSLGRGDARRPLKIFGAAGFVNLIGDIWLTLHRGWGAAGAATATVAAQVGATIYYVASSRRLDRSVEASSRPLRDVALAWRGPPTKKMAKTFLNVAMALFSRSVGLMLAYSMLTRTAALGGETALAAHQVTLQVWWLLSFLPEPMSVAAQTLIARDLKDRESRVPGLVRTLYGISGVLGLSAAALTGFVLQAPAVAGALVADPIVQKVMASLVPFAVLSQSYCPIAALSDGVCIGLGSFSHLPLIMAGSFLTTATGLAVVAGRNLGVVGVWACMNIFLSSRIAGHLLMSSKLRKYVRRAFRRDSMPEKSVSLIAA
ncbi:hypothetical protein ACHAWF_004795 [Thalassiosira exigua]